MKKNIFVAALVAVSFAVAVPAKAQFKFGVKAGLNVTTMSFKTDLIKTDNRAGFFVGATAEFTAPIGIGIDAAVQYEQRNVEAEIEDETGKTESSKQTLQYIAVPINFKYSLGLGGLAKVYAATGPQFSFNVGGKSLWENSYRLKDSEFSWNIGAGVRLLCHLQIGYNYNIALGNTAEVNLLDAASDLNKKLVGQNGKTNTHQVHLTYWF